MFAVMITDGGTRRKARRWDDSALEFGSRREAEEYAKSISGRGGCGTQLTCWVVEEPDAPLAPEVP